MKLSLNGHLLGAKTLEEEGFWADELIKIVVFGMGTEAAKCKQVDL